MQKFFPIVLIILDILAAVVYLGNGDIRRFVYWIAAAVLTITVTL
jgi:c-di-GMP-related signal transduction protein